MKPSALLWSAVAAVSLAVAPARADRSAAAAIAPAEVPSADPLDVPAALRAQIDAAIAACGCVDSVSALQVMPVGTPAEVFQSIDVLFAIVGLDLQLPWAAAGEIGAGALASRLGRQAGLVAQLSAYADAPGAGFRLGAYGWSRETQPDFCSGETLYLMYFPATGVLFAFRFDSSHEC